MPVADDPIASLLAGRYADPESGAWLRAESRAVVIEDSLAGAEDELVAGLGLGHRLVIVSDPRTHDALGARVERALAGRFTVQAIVLGDAPRADADTVVRLRQTIAPATDAIVAVGSGTINDLTKAVALDHGCPQLVFATAPSMNGYTSLGASIERDGVKRSIRTRTPVGVFVDLGVLAAAPARLIRAGLGDSACRPTAQVDWLMSHIVLDRPYREAPFALLAADEPALFGDPRALIAGDLAAMRHLVRTLVLSGFGMTICDGSYPASQGEHLLSHYLEMMRPPGAPDALHGEQIGVCTIAMARLQERVLARDRPPVLRPSTVDRADVMAHFGERAGDACWREYEHKRFDAARTDELNARLEVRWDELRERLDRVRIDADRIEGLLASAGAATQPSQLGIDDARFSQALARAREIRDRYTFLDLDADAA